MGVGLRAWRTRLFLIGWGARLLEFGVLSGVSLEKPFEMATSVFPDQNGLPSLPGTVTDALWHLGSKTKKHGLPVFIPHNVGPVSVLS